MVLAVNFGLLVYQKRCSDIKRIVFSRMVFPIQLPIVLPVGIAYCPLSIVYCYCAIVSFRHCVIPTSQGVFEDSQPPKHPRMFGCLESSKMCLLVMCLSPGLGIPGSLGPYLCG